MARILRGDIFWADLNPTRGHEQSGLRPVVIVSQDIFNERSGTVIAMAITSQPQRAGFPLTLELTDVEMPKQSWVKISQIRTLSAERLGEKIGRVSEEILVQLIEGLNEIVGEWKQLVAVGWTVERFVKKVVEVVKAEKTAKAKASAKEKKAPAKKTTLKKAKVKPAKSSPKGEKKKK